MLGYVRVKISPIKLSNLRVFLQLYMYAVLIQVLHIALNKHTHTFDSLMIFGLGWS